MAVNKRAQDRKVTDCTVELTWKTEDGQKYFEECRALDLSASGVAIECPEAVPLSASVIVRAPAFQVAALAQVRHCSWNRTIYVIGLRFLAKTTTVQGDPRAPDHYEILRLNHSADQDTIERVYRTLAKRFHPDNSLTGDAEAFLRICDAHDAHRVLADPSRRRSYDLEREAGRKTPRFQLQSREFFCGIVGEKNRRLAALCLLYRETDQQL